VNQAMGLNPSIKSTLHSQGPAFFVFSLLKQALLGLDYFVNQAMGLNPSIKSTLHSQGPAFFVFSAY
jgi:hypothetical protein